MHTRSFSLAVLVLGLSFALTACERKPAAATEQQQPTPDPQAAEKRLSAEREMTALRQKRDRQQVAVTELPKFQITKAKFSRLKAPAGTVGDPIIELALTNGTSIPVGHAFFAGTLTSPGKPEPVLKSGFNYRLPGGLKPGETREVKLAPDKARDWGTVDAPADAVLTVEAVRLDGIDDQVAYDIETYLDGDAKRLKELETKFPPK